MGSNTLKHTVFDYDVFQIYTKYHSAEVLQILFVFEKQFLIVLDVLKEKHPEPVSVDEKAFANCDELPAMMDVTITSGHAC